MRNACDYRGYRRNAAREQRKVARAEKRDGGLQHWRKQNLMGQSNIKANINPRAQMAHAATQVAAKAMVEAGVLAQPSVAIAAMLRFYKGVKPPRSRVVNRIIRELTSQIPRLRNAA